MFKTTAENEGDIRPFKTSLRLPEWFITDRSKAMIMLYLSLFQLLRSLRLKVQTTMSSVKVHAAMDRAAL